MKESIRLLAVVFLLVSAHKTLAPAIGYINTSFTPGENLFANPFNVSPNALSALFYDITVPNGTTVSLWNPTTASFGTTSTNYGNIWSVDLVLQPGTGALLNAPVAFVNTFVGTVLNHDGNPISGGSLVLPPEFSGPNGIYLLADKFPVTDTGNDIFLNIIGRMPNYGEQVTLLNNVSKIYTTSTYLGNGNWDNLPTLAYGNSAFFNIQSVPEPSALSMLGVSTLLCCWRIKRKIYC